MKNRSFITFPIFEKYPELFCAFSTRAGGYSKNKYATMNMGLTSGDNIDTVKKNREQWFKQFGIDEKKLVMPKQTHSAYVKKINNAGIYDNTDGLYTNNQNIFLSVQTADCFPVFIYDPDKKVVGLVHSGWQGASKGIVPEILNGMKKDYNVVVQNLTIAIGPGIQSTCFEVREDVYSKFSDEFISEHPEPDKKFLDLQMYIKYQFINLGINKNNIYAESTCTHCEELQYYSYRRDKHHSGRMLGIISLKNALST